jgi:hypothetical protein
MMSHENLQFLSLRRNAGITGAAWCRFYRALEHGCYCLHSLYNDHADGLAGCHPAMMVHQQHHTTTLSSSSCDDDASTTTSAVAVAEIYLGLNNLGRGELLRATHDNGNEEKKEAWFAMLDSIADSPAALYAMISQHPTLFVNHPE